MSIARRNTAFRAFFVWMFFLSLFTFVFAEKENDPDKARAKSLVHEYLKGAQLSAEELAFIKEFIDTPAPSKKQTFYSRATTVLEEHFTTGALPTGWQNIANIGTEVWYFNNPGGLIFNSTTSGDGFAIFDSDFNGSASGAEDADLITPALDCSGLSQVMLEFEHFFQSGFGGAADLYVSGDNGANWTLVDSWAATSTANAEPESYDISAIAAGQSQVLVRWNWTGDYSWWWALDDVYIFQPSVNYVGQYYANAGNPGGINTEGDAPGISGWTNIVLGPQSANIWSPTQAIPFAFEFYGTPVTHFKASQNCVVTFDTTVTALPGANTNLPSSDLPPLSIAGMWDTFTITPPTATGDDVRTKVFGTAPNRQLWIKWYSFEYGNVSFAYNAIVLEETTNKIYVVDQYSSTTPLLTTTVGLQFDGTTAAQYGDSLIPQAGNGSTNPDNDYWEFFIPSGDDVGTTNVTVDYPGFLLFAGNSATIEVTVQNFGANDASGFDVTYMVSDGSNSTVTYSGTLASGASDVVIFPTAWTPADSGNYAVTAYTTYPPDANPTNDTTVVAQRVDRPETLNYEQDFTAYSGSSNSIGFYGGDNQNFGTFTPSTTNDGAWTFDDFGNDPLLTRSARFNFFSTSSADQDWIITPPLDMTTGIGAPELKYDIAATAYTGTAHAFIPVGDTLFVVASTDGETWSRSDILAQYTSDDSIPAAGMTVSIDLTSYATETTLYIGFLAMDPANTGDMNVYIDNVFVGTPPAVDLSVTAFENLPGTVLINAAVDFDVVVSNLGGDPVSGATLDVFLNGSLANTYPVPTLASGTSVNIAASVTAPGVPGAAVIKADVNAAGDVFPANDSLSASVNVITALPNILIWVGPTAGAVNAASGDSIFDALVANGENAYLTNNLFEFGSDLSIYEIIFVVLGIYSTNHTILAADPEGPALEAYLAAGGHIYLEGGDCFNYDPETGGYNIRPWFSLNDGNDGSGDLLGIIGLADLSAFSFAYTGLNSFMDELVPVASTAIWQNNANTDISGVFYAGFAPGSGRTIGVVPSFGGLVDSPEPFSPLAQGVDQSIPQDPSMKEFLRANSKKEPVQPFVKKWAYHPELKRERSKENPLYRMTPGGPQIMANTKVDLMAAYLDLFRAPATPPVLAVDPLSLSETLVAGNSSAQTLSISNTGGALAGDLTWSISENPAVGWLEVAPTAGTTTGGSTANVTVTFTANVAPGNYSASLDVTSNGGSATVSVSLTVQQGPVMVVTPTLLDVTLPQGATQDETITITNNGDLPLDFTVSIVPLTAASTKVTVKTGTAPENTPRAVSNPNPAAAYDLAEASGSPAVKLDPNYRHPRAGELSVLYDNGPFVNLPGGGFGGADASVLQSAIQLNTYGFGHAVASGFRVADDFVVPAGGWNIDKITFYSYQTGSTTTSTINNVNFRIWDGPPGDPGSNVVFGDVTTNRLTATSWTNSYRSLDTAPLASNRPIMTGECGGLGLFLAPGTYWLDWQTGGTLASGPWAIPITINGVTITGNGLQYDPTAMVWNPLVDTGTSGTSQFFQGLPFIIEGTPANFWLSVGTTAGTVPAGGSVNVTVTFDADTLPGDYYADIVVSGNDANNPSDVVNAHMEVTGGCTTGLLGDVNGDGAVTSLDALLILTNDVGIPVPQPVLDRIAIGFGDVIDDGLVNSTDALKILTWEVGIPVPNPQPDDVVCLPVASLGKSTLPPAAEGTEVNAYAVLNLSGQTLEVPVTIDLANSGEKLGSYTMTLSWNPALLEFTGFSGGNTDGFADPVVNDLNAKQGRLVAAHAYPRGGEGEVNVLNARFTLKGNVEALSGNPVSLGFSAMA
ncbi:MAG: hypothetical protein HUU32_22940, partial [Calditrichaceae bacterium]|nr:hypothetical protein [Calditrichaceae bacterium]